MMSTPKRKRKKCQEEQKLKVQKKVARTRSPVKILSITKQPKTTEKVLVNESNDKEIVEANNSEVTTEIED